MKLDYLEKLTARERLNHFVYYLKNRHNYSPEDRERLDDYFEDS